MLTKRPDCSNSDGAVKKEMKEKRRRRRSSSEKRTVSLIYKTRSLDKEAEQLRNQIKELDKKTSSDKKSSPKSYSKILQKPNGTANTSSSPKTRASRSSPSMSPIHCSSSSSSSSGSDSESSCSSTVSITAPDLNSFDNGSPSRKKQRVRRKVTIKTEPKTGSPKVELNFDSIDPQEEGELSDEHYSRMNGDVVDTQSKAKVGLYNGHADKTREARQGNEKRKGRRNGHRLPTWLRKSIGFNNEIMSFLDKKDLEGLYQIVKENYESLQLCKEKMELKWAIEKMGRENPDSENYKTALEHYGHLDTKHAERLEAAYHKDMRYADIRKIEDQVKAERAKASLNNISPEPMLPAPALPGRKPPPTHRSPPLPPSTIIAAPYRQRPAAHCRYEERKEIVHRREEVIRRGYVDEEHRRGYEERRVYPLSGDRLRRSSYEARPYPAY